MLEILDSSGLAAASVKPTEARKDARLAEASGRACWVDLEAEPLKALREARELQEARFALRIYTLSASGLLKQERCAACMKTNCKGMWRYCPCKLAREELQLEGADLAQLRIEAPERARCCYREPCVLQADLALKEKQRWEQQLEAGGSILCQSVECLTVLLAFTLAVLAVCLPSECRAGLPKLRAAPRKQLCRVQLWLTDCSQGS